MKQRHERAVAFGTWCANLFENERRDLVCILFENERRDLVCILFENERRMKNSNDGRYTPPVSCRLQIRLECDVSVCMKIQQLLLFPINHPI
jgi:hypothetical protein